MSEPSEPDLAELFARQGFAHGPEDSATRVVRRTAEFARVAALPWLAPERVCDAEFAASLSLTYRRDPNAELRPIQAVALSAALRSRGLFAPIGVGQGKTLITLLLPTVLGATRAVLLVPAPLRDQLARELPEYAARWQIYPERITVVTYSELSSAKGAQRLEELSPDLVIADEAHALRHPSAARTKRFLRYMHAHPETIFCALSGTITARSLEDYAHLLTLALRDRAPVPRSPHEVKEWALALDSDVPYELRYEPGALLEFCTEADSPREGYQRRLVSAPGVVASFGPGLGTGLEINSKRPRVPARITQALRDLETESAWKGIQLDPLGRARVARELALGFWYEWNWPRHAVDHEWLQKRNAWSRAVSVYLDKHAHPGCDSPLLVTRRLDSGVALNSELRTLKAILADWRTVSDRPEPPVRAVWFESWINEVVRAWLASDTAPGIVWYEHAGVARSLCDAREDLHWVPPSEDVKPYEGRSVALSIRAHGTGKNLQAWSRNLVLTPPRSGATWEQLLGRTHREGQTADVVRCDVLQHAACYRDAVRSARSDAQYIHETTGTPQKLLQATWLGF